MVFTRWLVSPQEEESEEEPKLKYERLSNGVTEILQKDAASCMTVHDKVPVLLLLLLRASVSTSTDLQGHPPGRRHLSNQQHVQPAHNSLFPHILSG